MDRELSFKIGNDISIEFALIPAGSFIMGSPKDETGRRVNDETLHPVIISRPFYMGIYPVTQGQYKAVTGMNPSDHRLGDKNPVECVNWHDAMKYCERLNNAYGDQLPEGYRFTLPTEAQWEYACRAGTETPLYNGKMLTGMTRSDTLDDICWYLGTTGESGHRPAGTKKANAFGLYDLLGNIHEWVYDNYGRYPESATDPTGPEQGGEKVVRGGSWKSPAWRCRAARRGVDAPFYRLDGLGFRVAISDIIRC